MEPYPTLTLPYLALLYLDLPTYLTDLPYLTDSIYFTLDYLTDFTLPYNLALQPYPTLTLLYLTTLLNVSRLMT